MDKVKKSPFEKEYEIAWDKYSKADLKKVFDLSDRYGFYVTL